jgi:hypothetical protein
MAAVARIGDMRRESTGDTRQQMAGGATLYAFSAIEADPLCRR